MTTETKVEAVAWRVRIGDSDMWSYGSEWDVDFHGKQSGLPYVTERLYPQSALDALRGECVRIERENREGWKQAAHHRQRADAAERRVAELEGAIEAALTIINKEVDPKLYPVAEQSIRSALTKESP